jgi:3-hydroxyisobutyrate dehydrogenase
MRLGYIGLGNMGTPIAARLVREYEVAVYDRNNAAMARLMEYGATAYRSAAQVGADCDVVLLCLPTSDHVHAVLLDDDGIADVAKPGTVVIDQTTGDPSVTRAMAVELDQRGIALVDAPVSGGPAGAEQGTIAIMVGATDAHFKQVAPILRTISTKVFHAGDIGAGHLVKLVNNMLSAVQTTASLEVLALAAKNGVDPGRAVDIILANSGRNYYLETFVKSHVLTGNLSSGFTLEVLHKDTRLACRLGAESGVPMLFGSLARDVYQISINGLGSHADGNAIAVAMDRFAASHLVPGDHTF